MDKKIKYWLLGICSAIGLFFVFGIPTRLIPTPWFARMIPATIYDYVILILTSALLGAFIGVHYYKKHTRKVCSVAAYTGGIGGVLAFGCPICNQILVVLFGTTALMVYFEPYRPLLGLVSVIILMGALYWVIKR